MTRAATAAAGPADGWRRLHPVTPVLRGWRVLAVFAAVGGEQGLRGGEFRVYGYSALAVLPVAIGLATIAWRRTRWRVEGGDLRIERGVVVRRSRRVPLARLQAVDVVRPLLGRMLGVAELRLEVVGHHGTEATLSYLGEDEAHAVRARLLAVAHGLAEETPAAPESVVLTVPNSRLVASLLLSGLTLTLLLIVAYVSAAALLAPAALAGTVGAVVPALLTVGRRFAIEFGFTVAASPDGLRLRHGLLETRAQTVPEGRVQAVRIVEPLLWRPFGWVRVEVDVAGYRRGHGAEERIATSALLPVAPRAEADAVLGLVFRDVLRNIPAGVGGEHDDQRRGGLRLDALPTIPPPRRALLRAPLTWHFLGFATDPRWVVSSGGRLRRVTDVVPHGKVQSLRFVQGPVARWLRLATVHLDTAGRDVHAAARFRDAAEARRLFGELTDLARARRREQGILAAPLPPPARPPERPPARPPRAPGGNCPA